jgi:drug/metabolite transporter superfamily protein YnfA
LRKILSFVCASALVGGGLYLVAQELYAVEAPGKMMTAAGGFLVVIGLIWLWADFVDPEPPDQEPK